LDFQGQRIFLNVACFRGRNYDIIIDSNGIFYLLNQLNNTIIPRYRKTQKIPMTTLPSPKYHSLKASAEAAVQSAKPKITRAYAMSLGVLLEAAHAGEDAAWVHPYLLAAKAGTTENTAHSTLRFLQDQAYASVRKTVVNGRRRVEFRLTAEGVAHAVAVLRYALEQRSITKSRTAKTAEAKTQSRTR
jgi:hypothetical protein